MKQLLASIERGGTVQVRTETMLRALIQQGHAAHLERGDSYAEWEQNVTANIPQLCNAVALDAGTGAMKARAGDPGT